MIIGTRAKAKVPPVEPGTYLAICVGVYDLGEQQTEWNGKTRYSNQLMLTFELAGLTIEVDGEQKPRQLSRRFNVSTSKNSGLRKFLTSWRGKAFTDEELKVFNTDSLLGQTAMLQIVHDETGEYSNIDGIMQIPRGMPAPSTTSELYKFNIDDWDDREFENLPEWVQETIKKSTQYQQMHAPDTAVDFPQPTQVPSAPPQAAPQPVKQPAAKPAPANVVEEEPPF